MGLEEFLQFLRGRIGSPRELGIVQNPRSERKRFGNREYPGQEAGGSGSECSPGLAGRRGRLPGIGGNRFAAGDGTNRLKAPTRMSCNESL